MAGSPPTRDNSSPHKQALIVAKVCGSKVDLKVTLVHQITAVTHQIDIVAMIRCIFLSPNLTQITAVLFVTKLVVKYSFIELQARGPGLTVCVHIYIFVENISD